MTARDDVLARVRSALHTATPDRWLRRINPHPALPRRFRAPPTQQGGATSGLVDLFEERVADYRAVVVRCTEAEVADAVRHGLADSGTVVVPDGFPDDLLGLPTGARRVTDDGLDAHALDAVDAVVTLATVGIAETGTIILDHGTGQGRRALSLVPDRHVCVVRADQVVADVPEAVTLLDRSGAATRPMTWISGPSATSDIELDRVEGVHGPRTLHVVIVV